MSGTDPRISALLRERAVQCTLRKQNKTHTVFFYERLREYAKLSERPDAFVQPVAGLKDRLFTALKFVGKPNDAWRKDAYISDKWPPLASEIVPYL